MVLVLGVGGGRLDFPWHHTRVYPVPEPRRLGRAARGVFVVYCFRQSALINFFPLTVLFQAQHFPNQSFGSRNTAMKWTAPIFVARISGDAGTRRGSQKLFLLYLVVFFFFSTNTGLFLAVDRGYDTGTSLLPFFFLIFRRTVYRDAGRVCSREGQ